MFLVVSKRLDFRENGDGALCVEIVFKRTFPKNQDETVKLKSELIFIKGAGGRGMQIAIHQSFYGDAILSLIKSFYFTLYLLIC